MLSTDYLVTKMKALLPIYSDEYDDQLAIVVSGAVSKLTSEGVPNVFTEGSDQANDYILCVSYQTALDMDFGIDYNRLMEQYITRVNTLRTYHDSQSNG